MHPVIVYELAKTRIDQDAQAALSRLARAEMPRVPRSSRGTTPQMTADDMQWRRYIAATIASSTWDPFLTQLKGPSQPNDTRSLPTRAQPYRQA